MDLSETLIVQNLKEGNEHAYKYVFDAHYDVLCVIAARYLHDDFVAESVVGDVIFHLWETRENIDIQTSLRQYLVRSVRNRCLDYLKSRRFRHEQTLSTLSDDSRLLERPANHDHPLGYLLEKELEQTINDAIERLPDDCRRVFKMSRLEGKKNAEIARELGISVNTVKYHMKHALRLLQQQLGKYFVFLLMAYFA
ncbi:RNA polymerase sigma-70 factor [Prevotella sp. A2931]|uniref:RNA polymerase sigma-70 factor n=1 Tax=Prevotella illustrans TaxID=2800387 RepID=A0ABS3M2A4_9BACT|nr:MULTISPECIES: RNA polymerase sigma-70 factor [Prevotella]MBO1362319.1 RNA polymerase sigma-70 factor [Prevotella illustrans]PTL26433.1 RNA polymerase sigma-70 factor [Prevotella sp. oral taxon 820]